MGFSFGLENIEGGGGFTLSPRDFLEVLIFAPILTSLSL